MLLAASSWPRGTTLGLLAQQPPHVRSIDESGIHATTIDGLDHQILAFILVDIGLGQRFAGDQAWRA